MTIKQSRYITAETEAQKKVRVTEVQKIDEDPYIRRSEVQQTVSNSTLPVSSRAVNLAIEDKIERGDLATKEYVNNKVSSIDLSEYALTSDLSSAIESINSDLELKADKSDLEGFATEDYVNEKIDEKEVGITEPELISKSVGSGKWMREGAYGFGGAAPNAMSSPEDYVESSRNPLTEVISSNNFITIEGKTLPAWVSGLRITRNSAGHGVKFLANGDRLFFGRDQIREVYSDYNTFPDSNGVLHNSRNPIDTLNTSDMADTVVDNDLLTVTSGAVFRAIKQLADQIISLEARVRELEDGGV